MSGVVATGTQINEGVMKHPGLMSIKELAVYLGKSTAWVYNNKEELPHRKIGRIYFFDRGAINEWIKGDRPAVTEAESRSRGFARKATKSRKTR